MYSDPDIDAGSDLGTLLQTQVLDSLDEVYYLLSPGGKLVEWNESVPEVTGYSHEEIEEMSAVEFFDKQDRERVAESIATVITDGRQVTIEADFLTKDGRYLPYEFSGTPVYESGEIAGVVGSGRDSTDLREQKRRLQTVTDNVPIVLFAVDSNGRFIFSRGRGLQTLGMDPDEVVGQSISDVYPDVSEIQTDINRALDGEEFRTVTKIDGQVFEVWYQPIESGRGIEKVVGVARDITERYEKEQQLEEQTSQLEVLNRMVRHDIRNDLMVLLAWAREAESQLDEDKRQPLERVIDAAEHIRELTETAQDYMELITGAENVATRPMDLPSVVIDEVERRRSMFDAADFVIEGPIPTTSVKANEMLATVFRNLLNNAVQHNDTDNPTVTVSVERQPDTVSVTIADNGPGVPDREKADIFGKGDRSLDSEGTGIGLYLVHTLVKEFGGDVWVEDNDPRGARFVVELPRLAQD
jgi:PAS domain S-box-containing protein